MRREISYVLARFATGRLPNHSEGCQTKVNYVSLAIIVTRLITSAIAH